jgi:hypothetical protein
MSLWLKIITYTANYVFNQSPSWINQGRIEKELLNLGGKPNLEYLRIFGYVSHALILKSIERNLTQSWSYVGWCGYISIWKPTCCSIQKLTRWFLIMM